MKVKTRLLIIVLRFFVFVHTETFWKILHFIGSIGIGLIMFTVFNQIQYLIISIVIYPVYHYFYYHYKILKNPNWNDDKEWFTTKLRNTIEIYKSI